MAVQQPQQNTYKYHFSQRFLYPARGVIEGPIGLSIGLVAVSVASIARSVFDGLKLLMIQEPEQKKLQKEQLSKDFKIIPGYMLGLSLATVGDLISFAYPPAGNLGHHVIRVILKNIWLTLKGSQEAQKPF